MTKTTSFCANQCVQAAWGATQRATKRTMWPTWVLRPFGRVSSPSFSQIQVFSPKFGELKLNLDTSTAMRADSVDRFGSDLLSPTSRPDQVPQTIKINLCVM